MVTAGKVPLPDNYVEITASGIVINYQGEAGERVLEQLGISNGGKDPKDETYYTYSTNTSLTKYQLLGFMEGDPIASVLDETFAVSDLSERQIRIYGNELGIVLDDITNIPVTTTVDILNTTDNYKTTFSEEVLVEGTGSELFTYFYNRNKVLLIDKELAKLDDSLVGYWDMDTTTLSGATTVLRDFSKYGNNGILSGGIVVGGADGKNGNATYFDGDDDIIIIDDSASLDISQNLTISVSVNVSEYLLFSTIIAKSNNNYRIFINQDLTVQNRILINGIQLDLITLNSNINLGEWVNITYTYDGSMMKLYLDGNFLGSKLVEGSIDLNDSKMIIGNWDISLGRPFSGLINSVKVYNRALSDDEVKVLYDSVK